MKKTYIAPTMEAITVQMTQKLCMASLESDADLLFGGETPVDFGPDDMR